MGSFGFCLLVLNGEFRVFDGQILILWIGPQFSVVKSQFFCWVNHQVAGKNSKWNAHMRIPNHWITRFLNIWLQFFCEACLELEGLETSPRAVGELQPGWRSRGNGWLGQFWAVLAVGDFKHVENRLDWNCEPLNLCKSTGQAWWVSKDGPRYTI